MAHFRDREGQDQERQWLGWRLRDTEQVGFFLTTHASKVGRRQHNQRHVPVPPKKAAHFIVIQAHVFGLFKILLNGLITNDKFCMSRTARLQLSWWRLPRSARQPNSQGVQSPVEENVREYLPHQETYEKTTMERSAQLRGTA